MEFSREVCELCMEKLQLSKGKFNVKCFEGAELAMNPFNFCKSF